MRKTITGTGGMLLIQTLKDAGVEYLFTNPGSAETGIFAALAEDRDQRLVVGKHEGLVAAMADGYHRISGKVGVVIAHVMGGSYQLAGQLFNAQVAGSSAAGDRGRLGLRAAGLPRARAVPRARARRSRCARSPRRRAAPTRCTRTPRPSRVATIRALREATTPPTGPVYLSISAELLQSRRARGDDRRGRAATGSSRRARRGRRRSTAIARRLGEAQCPVLMFGDDVWRDGAQAEAVRLAEVLEAPVFASRQIFAELPRPASALLRQLSGVRRTSRRPPASSRT